MEEKYLPAVVLRGKNNKHYVRFQGSFSEAVTAHLDPEDE